MQFTRKFLINGKEPEKFSEGTLEKCIFTDVESGEQFCSFMDMAEKFGCTDYVGSESFGTEKYHKYAPYSLFLFTDGVYEFCEQHEAWWLMDVVSSYVPDVCEILAIPDRENGGIKFVENTKGLDDKDSFLVISVIKTGDNSCMFTVEKEVWNEEKQDSENKSIVTQYIPYTDLDVDQIEWFMEGGVLLHPQEH